MNTKIKKLLVILVSAAIIMTAVLEGLWLFAVPNYINSHLESSFIKDKLMSYTGLVLTYEKAFVKTKPDFQIDIFLNNVKLSDKNHPDIFSLKSFKASIKTPDLLFKKLNLKNIYTENMSLVLTRNKDGKFFLGNYALPQKAEETAKKFDFKMSKISMDIKNSCLIFDDKLLSEKSKITIDRFKLTKYIKDKYIDFSFLSNISINEKNTLVDVSLTSKLPLTRGMGEKNFKLSGTVKDVYLSDYSDYIAYFSKQEIKNIQGLINAEFSSNSDILLYGSLKDFSIDMKDPLDSIKSDSEVKLEARLFADSKKLYLKDIIIKAKNWETDIKGKIIDYKAKKPKLELDINIPDSDIHSMYWLMPSIEGDPQESMKKFKKYGAWGKAKGKMQIKGTPQNPEVYGGLEVYDVYIVKNNPLVPHCKIFVKFLKDKVKVTTRVFAGHDEYVDVDGIAEMKINGAGDFHISSSENVDLDTARYILVPIHEVVGFDLGPVPYMELAGKGNIDIHTLGTVLDGEVTGVFNFKNTTAELHGLNTKIEKADGKLVFDKRDMHFYTTKAFIKNQPVKIDGKADLAGNIDFDVTAPSIDSGDLLDILRTSPMLNDKKAMVSPVDKMTGKSDTKIKIKGLVKDFQDLLKNQTLLITGSMILKNNSGKLNFSSVTAENINGKIEFDDTDWLADITGMLGSSKFTAKGSSKEGRSNIKISADALKTDELLDLLNKAENNRFSSLPKTNSLVSFNGEYKSNTMDFDINNLKAEGSFKPIIQKQTSPFQIISGTYKVNNGNAELTSFSAKLFDSKIHLSGKTDNVFSEKPVFSYNLNMSDFDLKSFNSLKKMPVLPDYIKKILNAYENYEGIANVSIDCRKNRTKGYIKLKDVKFNHSYFKTPVSIAVGNILLNDEKIVLKSLIAQVDNTPVFINASVWDLDKTMHFSGYFTTKLTDYFANKYINAHLTYPIKPKGDITVTSDINGTFENFTIKPKIKLAKDADIYYMGANLGDEDNIRELNADITVSGNTYFLRKADYVRYMTSQNDRIYPLTILSTNGIFTISNKNIHIRNMNIDTKNSANVKMFNAIFKKSVLKNGMFDCHLNVRGNINTPLVSGFVTMKNLDMPLYDTNIKNIEIKFKEKLINIKLDGQAYDSDFSLEALVQNKFTPPYIIEKFNIHSNEVNLDTLIDSLTKIPTPNTVIKMSNEGSAQKTPFVISDVQIKNGFMSANNIIIRGLPASDYIADFKLGKDMVLKIDKLGFDITTGKINGTASYNFADNRIKAELSAYNVDSNKIASSLFDFKDQIFGKANGSLVMTTTGDSETERVKNLSGYVYFDVSDGRMPKLGSVEYLLKAGNLIKSGITGASISNFIDLLAPIKTGYFDSIKGKLALKNGVAQDIEVYSKGDNLNMYINGEYDILQQYANMRIYGRLTKKATNILGAVGNLSFNSILNAIPGFKLDKADKMKIIKDLNKIPGVELSDQQYRVFTAKIDGKINEEKYVRSFRWIE